jgi:hypothetical protein
MLHARQVKISIDSFVSRLSKSGGKPAFPTLRLRQSADANLIVRLSTRKTCTSW